MRQCLTQENVFFTCTDCNWNWQVYYSTEITDTVNEHHITYLVTYTLHNDTTEHWLCWLSNHRPFPEREQRQDNDTSVQTAEVMVTNGW